MARQFAIAGNTKDGRLFRLHNNSNNGEATFEGERRIAGGKYETRRFIGKEADVRRQWKTWQIDARHEAAITIDKKAAPKPPQKEVPQLTTTKKDEGPKEVYVLAFVDAYEKRTDIGAYLDMDKAADMVDALTVAAKATGQKGEYDVFKLDVRG